MPVDFSFAAIEAASAPARAPVFTSPVPLASLMKNRIRHPLGTHFGISNFGVNLTYLPPGSISAPRQNTRPKGVSSARIVSPLEDHAVSRIRPVIGVCDAAIDRACADVPIYSQMRFVLVSLCIALTLSACGGGSSAPATQSQGASTTPPPLPEMTGLPTVPKPQFLSIGTPGGPVVIVLGLSAEGTLFGTEAWDGIPYLVNAQYQILSLDLPCQCGCTRKRRGCATLLGAAVGGWRQQDVSRLLCWTIHVLDTVGVKKAAVVGVSRGGYAAITCAAYDNESVDVA